MRLALGASLAPPAVAGSAHAQSAVTLYGSVDDDINWTSNSGGHDLCDMSRGGCRRAAVNEGIAKRFVWRKQQEIRTLQRLLGKKTVEDKILRGRSNGDEQKKLIARSSLLPEDDR